VGSQTQPLISRRRLLQVGGGLAAAGVLAACGRRSQDGEGGDDDAAGSTPEEPAEAPVANDGSRTELSLWIVDHDGEVRSRLEQDILPRFEEEHPQYRVSTRFSGWERYAEEVTTAFTGGVGPDVYQGGAVWVGQQVDRGWALPLTGYVADAAEWNWDDFTDGAREDVSVDGEIYAIPYRVAPRTLWYRSDILAEDGFTEPPTDWEQLREVANATVRRENGRIVREGFDTFLGGGPAWQGEMQTYWDFMHAAGGRFLSEDLSRCTLDEDPAVEALQFLVGLVLEDEVMPYPSFENQGELSALELGLTATGMMVELPDLRAREYAPDQAEFVRAAAPLRHAVQAAHIYVNKYFVSSGTKDPDGSWLLLQHLTSADNLETYSAASGYLSPRASQTTADYLTDNMRIVAEAGATGVPYPRHHNLLELFRPVSENLDRCFRGQLTASETLQRTVEEVNALL